MTLQGHLFVVQADLSRIAADAFLIPCDSNVNVSGGWRPFVEPGSEPCPSWDWFRPAGVTLTDGLAFLPDPTPQPNEPDETGKKRSRMPDDIVGLRVLVDTVGVETIPAMVDRSISAVALAAAKARRHGGRSLPLVALPILGVGQGKFPGRRAEVVRELVGRLHEFVAAHPIDVALVLQRTSDYAAPSGHANWRTTPESTAGPHSWRSSGRWPTNSARRPDGENCRSSPAPASANPSASRTGRNSSPNSPDASWPSMRTPTTRSWLRISASRT
ncbi:MAG: hypothetical protein QM711_14865 [Micropruina sp.]|uniref:hypothetical protein n=1 Tax=Micropruina sp. TaxID=2737536 RepID=UPI0039E4FA8D